PDPTQAPEPRSAPDTTTCHSSRPESRKPRRRTATECDAAVAPEPMETVVRRFIFRGSAQRDTENTVSATCSPVPFERGRRSVR
ncbi:hypothetical protein C5E43_23730, partial [Nocardia cyriacigeorgica]